MIDPYSKEWEAIVAEIDKEIQKATDFVANMSPTGDAAKEQALTWMYRGQVQMLKRLKKLATKDESE